MWRLKHRFFLLDRIISRKASSDDFLKMDRRSQLLKLDRIPGVSNNINYKTKAGEQKEKTEFIPIDNYLKAPIWRASMNNEKTYLHLGFNGLEHLRFPLVWLRDNCQCKNCFDATSKSRIHDQQLLRINPSAKNITFGESQVTIKWDDEHLSVFSKEWLCKHSFHEWHQMERSKDRIVDKKAWTSIDFEKKIKFRSFKFSEILNSDHTLLEWLLQLAKYGVSLLTGTPNSPGQLEKISERIAFIRHTHYGGVFQVKGSDDANNVAYKKGALQLHTDLPYYRHGPGIVMLHCIKQSSEGGDNILADGLNAASQLSREMFNVLSEILVDWVDIGTHNNKKFHSTNREPVLCLNHFGLLEKINWSQPQRDSVFNVSTENVLQWYKAAAEFTKIIHHEDNAVIFKTKPGDILSFDNRRILHGRKNYTDSTRLLFGAYMDWDEIYSKIMVLKNEVRR